MEYLLQEAKIIVWNYKIDPKQLDNSWGDTIYTDFSDFKQESLKICVEIFDEKAAEKLQQSLPDCDCVRFSDGYWYKFTKKSATKENAIDEVKAVADMVIGDNDNEGIGLYLQKFMLERI